MQCIFQMLTASLADMWLLGGCSNRYSSDSLAIAINHAKKTATQCHSTSQQFDPFLHADIVCRYTFFVDAKAGIQLLCLAIALDLRVRC
jgi:hypothetical protein